MKPKSALALSALLVFTSSVGCTSISSTLLQRFDNDSMAGISNGQTGIKEHTRPFKGIPVTVKVPTHLDVSIKETLYFVETPEKGNLLYTPLTRRHLDVDTQLRYSDKLFAVDLKRPASGSLDYEIEFQNNTDNKQYFNKVSYHVVDETIKDITAIIAGLPAKNAKPAESKGADQPSVTTPQPKLKAGTRTVAWKRFDIHSPGFEDQVLEFVNRHLNNCNSCSLNGGCQQPTEYLEGVEPLPIVDQPAY